MVFCSSKEKAEATTESKGTELHHFPCLNQPRFPLPAHHPVAIYPGKVGCTSRLGSLTSRRFHFPFPSSVTGLGKGSGHGASQSDVRETLGDISANRGGSREDSPLILGAMGATVLLPASGPRRYTQDGRSKRWRDFGSSMTSLNSQPTPGPTPL